MTAVRVCSAADVPDGEVRGFDLGEQRLAIFCQGGEYFATDDVCSHEYALLSEGWFEEGTIECPRHGSRFDVRTGRPLSLPAVRPVRTYSVVREGDDLMVELG